MMTDEKENIAVKIDKTISNSNNKLVEELQEQDIKLDYEPAKRIKPDDEVKEKYRNLKSVGFKRSRTVNEVEGVVDEYVKEKEKISQNEYLKERLDELKEDYNHKKQTHPYRIIEFSKIYELLEKYNLYFGKAHLFIGNIPEKAADDINAYNENNFKWCPLFPRSKDFTYKNSLSEKDKENGAKSIKEFYICAPYDNFDHKDKKVKVVERYIYERDYGYSPLKLKAPDPSFLDPIVISPIKIQNDTMFDLQFFHVVTAWGPEAKDPEIFNSQMN